MFRPGGIVWSEYIAIMGNYNWNNSKTTPFAFENCTQAVPKRNSNNRPILHRLKFLKRPTNTHNGIPIWLTAQGKLEMAAEHQGKHQPPLRLLLYTYRNPVGLALLTHMDYQNKLLSNGNRPWNIFRRCVNGKSSGAIGLFAKLGLAQAA